MTSPAPRTSPLIPLDALAVLKAGSIMIDSDHIVTDWCPVLEECGFPAGECVGRPLRYMLASTGIQGECAETVIGAVADALAGTSRAVSNHVCATLPTPCHESYTLLAVPAEAGGARAAALLFIPSNSSEAIRAQYNRILDSTPDGIMILDRTKTVRIFNRAAGELLGRDPKEVMRTNCACGEVTGCHKEDGTSLSSQQLCPARELFEGHGSTQTEEMLCTNSRGEERWVETSYSSIRDAKGHVEFVIGVMRDVHERKRLEARLHQTEKLAALGQLTAGVAHEIKNPLGIILSSVELILDESRPRSMQVEAATFIKEEVQRLDGRIRTFLQFARPNPPHPEPTVLNGVVRRSLRMFAPACEGVAIEQELATPEVIVQLDPDQFQQVIMNLLLNAAEAAGRGGRVLVRTLNEPDHVVFEMHDSGPGIPEDDRRAIFDPFFTTKAHGTGLGLSIVHQIVQGHKGTVTVGKSKLGGAHFRITLPCRSKMG